MGETLNLALALEGRAQAAPENEQLLVIAEALAELPEPQIDPQFMLALEQRILTEELDEQQSRGLHLVPEKAPAPAKEVVHRAPVVQMPKRRFVVRRSIAAIAAAASLAAFPIAAAASSLPGSPFYGLKNRIENIQLALFGTPVEDAFRHLDLFEKRMNEIEQLTALEADLTLIQATIAAAERHLRTAELLVIGNTSDRATIRSLGEKARAAELRLRDVAPVMSPAAGETLDGAIITSIDIQRAVDDLLGINGPMSTVERGTRGVISSGSSSTSRSSSGTKTTTSSTRNHTSDGGTGDTDDNVAGHQVSDVAEGCQVPGSADGLGDLAAPVAKVMCI